MVAQVERIEAQKYIGVVPTKTSMIVKSMLIKWRFSTQVWKIIQ